MDGIKLSMNLEVMEYIVEKAMELKLGARGLRSIVEAILTDAMFDAPSSNMSELKVDLEYAKTKFENSKISKLKAA